MCSCTVANNLPTEQVNEDTDIISVCPVPDIGQITYYYILVRLAFKLVVYYVGSFGFIAGAFLRSELCDGVV